ncbi:MAG: tRNA lysidine(34) synthetase TilS [Alphaproteobacteria bacterium]|nr:tRNA lysidine(34) synthetase TilS [Alphaproteobacteria bacterium]
MIFADFSPHLASTAIFLRQPARFADSLAGMLIETVFASQLDALLPTADPSTPPRLAIAVSGGADSLALLRLAADWVRSRGGMVGEAVCGLTVDHRLRPESTAEAAQVQAWLAALGIPHHTLTWQRADASQHSPTPHHQQDWGGNLQAAARQARYHLLEGWCQANGWPLLLTAHQRDDVAEHLLLRLKRGSGLYGLAAPAAVIACPWGHIVRPLLTTRHQDCIAYLQAHGQAWIEDPSNQDGRFDRVRIRQLLADYPDLLPSDRLAMASLRLQDARQVVEQAVEQFWAAAVTPTSSSLSLNHRALLASLPEVRWRVLARALHHIGQTPYPPRFEDLQRLWQRLVVERRGRATLNHCLISLTIPASPGLSDSASWLIQPEPPRPDSAKNLPKNRKQQRSPQP